MFQRFQSMVTCFRVFAQNIVVVVSVASSCLSNAPLRPWKRGDGGDGRHWFLFPGFISLAHSTEVGSMQGPHGS